MWPTIGVVVLLAGAVAWLVIANRSDAAGDEREKQATADLDAMERGRDRAREWRDLPRAERRRRMRERARANSSAASGDADRGDRGAG